MDSFGACAVAAAAFPPDAARMKELLAENGFSEILCVGDGIRALELVRNRTVDALVTDLVLPGMDGAELAARVGGMPLTVRPTVIVLAPAGMQVRRPVQTLEKPLTQDALRRALEAQRPDRRSVPEEKKLLAARTLDALGVPEHCGRDYLLRCIGIAWQDARWVRALSPRMYPAVAAEYGVASKHVERAVRHVIDVAWRSGEIDAQYELFRDTIDAKRGCPTCGEMIARIADILRWEGNA